MRRDADRQTLGTACALLASLGNHRDQSGIAPGDDDLPGALMLEM